MHTNGTSDYVLGNESTNVSEKCRQLPAHLQQRAVITTLIFRGSASLSNTLNNLAEIPEIWDG